MKTKRMNYVTPRGQLALAIVSVLTVQLFTLPLHAEQFQKVQLVVPGAEKAREVKVILSLEETEMSVLTKENLEPLKVFRYQDIKTAEYSYSKHPRWKSGGVAAVAVGVLALPIFFMKGKKHWLTIQTGEDYAVLHLEKNDFRLIITAFETRSGVKVETVEEEK